MTKRGVPRKVDANQGEIVDALRKIGASIIDLSAVGGGAPDLAVGFLGKTYLLEVKNPKTKGKLNKLQQKWHDEWKGSVYVVYSAEEAIGIVREDCFI